LAARPIDKEAIYDNKLLSMTPTLRQLEYFVAVADHLSFRRAAEVCFVTQPGLSTQLRQLEDLIEVRLFERDRRKVLLTEAGKALLPAAREMLAGSRDFVSAARGLARPLTGTLRLGVIPTIAPYLLPQVLPRVRKSFPDLRLLLREGETKHLLDDLASGQLDILLVALEAELGDVEFLALADDPFFAVMRDDHRLADRERIRQNDLCDEEVLLLADGH